MASTRSRNTTGNYSMETRTNEQCCNYMLYPNASHGAAYDTRMPGNGLMPGQIPANRMSYNATDIQSYLWGIGSTNLVQPQAPVVAELAPLSSANVFERQPTLMPEPLTVPKYERPFPC